jgi:hypothetical protein
MAKNPLEIIHENSSKMDLPSYDILFERFVNGEWGNKKPKSALEIDQKTIGFMSATKDLNIALTKEKLCKLIDVYTSLREVTPYYQRIDAVLIISQLEQ